MSKNIHAQNITVTIPNKTLIQNSNLSLSYGSKYGILGRNGSGKTTLLKHIFKKDFGIPENFPIYYVGQEDEKVESNKTVYQVVLEADKVKFELVNRLNELEELFNSDNESDKLTEEYNQITEKLDQLEYYKDEALIRRILYGLGFERNHQDALYKDQSGGYKMRTSLAKGLFMNPLLLLLDEINNHLDLQAVVFITDYLKNKWKNTLLIVSHDINFLNQLCTHIIHLDNQQLKYHVGNYDNFLKSQAQEQATREKEWRIVENKIKEMKRTSTKKEIVDEFYEKNKDKEPPKPYKVNIRFNQTSELKNSLIEMKHVTFGYSDKIIFDDLEFDLANNDKYVLVGKNGVGKTTLIKLMSKQLKPNNDDAEILYNNRLKVSYYDQEFREIENNLKLTPVEYLQTIDTNINEFGARKLLGSIGLAGEHHLKPMGLLSGGEKARVQLVAISVIKPHVLLLDEPSNNLDIEAISSLTNAIKEFTGAMIIITHDIALIEETGCKILLLENNELVKMNFDEYYDRILEDIEDFDL